VDDKKNVHIDMTLTAPNCPAADYILEDVRMKIEAIDGVGTVDVNLVFEPEWNQNMMSDEAKVELGMM
jgi:metal-sulfur cluster biosynthetic enzyme